MGRGCTRWRGRGGGEAPFPPPWGERGALVLVGLVAEELVEPALAHLLDSVHVELDTARPPHLDPDVVEILGERRAHLLDARHDDP